MQRGNGVSRNGEFYASVRLSANYFPGIYETDTDLDTFFPYLEFEIIHI